jgi:hypothetical protein
MQESYTLNFDYFSFHTRCMLLLKAVYEEFEEEVKEECGALDWGSGELPVLPYWLFKWMGEETIKESILERLGRVMKGVVEEEGRKEIEALRSFLTKGRTRENGIEMGCLT